MFTFDSVILRLASMGFALGAAFCAQSDLKPALVNGHASSDVTVYAGTSGTLSLGDPTIKYAVWTPENTEIATITDGSKGLCAFLAPGMAVFKVTAFRAGASGGALSSEQLEAYVKVSGLPAKLDQLSEVWTRIGTPSQDVRPHLTANANMAVPATAQIVAKVADATLCSLTTDGGKTKAASLNLKVGQSFQVVGAQDSLTSVTVSCGDQSTILKVHAFDPTLTIAGPAAPSNQGKEFLVTASVGSKANGPICSSGMKVDLQIPNQTTLIQPFGSSSKVSLKVKIEQAGAVTLTASFDGSGGANPLTLVVNVKPVVDSIEFGDMRGTIVINDNATVPIRFFDIQGQPIARADVSDHLKLGLHRVAPLDGYPEPTCVDNAPPVGVVVTSTDSAGKPSVDKIHIVAAVPGKYDIWVSDGCHKSSAVRRDVVAPVELEAHLDTCHDPVDLFGPQVVREYYVFQIIVKNNLLFSEDAGNSQNTTVSILGNTVMFPATLDHGCRKAAAPQKSRGSNNFSFTNQTPGAQAAGDDIQLSTPQQVQNFAMGINDSCPVNVMVSPLLLERYTIIKNAIEYRDPVNVTHRFLTDLFNIANFFHDVNTASLPKFWDEALAPANRTNASALMQLLFADYATERGNKGNVSAANILSEHLNVPPGSPVLAYALISKSTLNRLYGQAKLRLTIYPFAHLSCYYTLVSAPQSTSANQPAPQTTPATAAGNSGTGASGMGSSSGTGGSGTN